MMTFEEALTAAGSIDDDEAWRVLEEFVALCKGGCSAETAFAEVIQAEIKRD